MVPPALLAALYSVSSLLGIPPNEQTSFEAYKVESLFRECGYATSPSARIENYPIGKLPWAAQPSPGQEPLAFYARDPEDLERPDGRILAVLVFPDESGAEKLFQQAAQRNQEGGLTVGGPATSGLTVTPPPPPEVTPDKGPAVVPGYSLSVWRRNIAALQFLVPPQASILEIARDLHQQGVELATATPEQTRAAAQHVAADMKPRTHDDLGASPFGVDHDFVECLDRA